MEHIKIQHIVIDADNPPDPHCKGAGDIDGDGFPDLLAASAAGGGLFWYRYPDWSKHRIAAGTFTTDMAVGDIDGDGFLDVVIPSDRGLMWYRNPRHVGKDPAYAPWEEILVRAAGAAMHDVELADLNQNGKLDIITRHQSGFKRQMGNAIHLWIQETPTGWRHRSFACPHGEGLCVSDINGNGRPDIMIGARWYENPGDVLHGTWIEHTYIPSEDFATQWTNGDVVVQVGDLTGDGKPEIVLSPAEGRGRLAWFESPGDPTCSPWIQHVIEREMDHVHGLALADMDADGQLDIVVAKMHQASAPQEVAIYFNRAKGQRWEKQVLATHGSHNIVVVDLGRSGHTDVFGANWHHSAPNHGTLEAWLNLGK